MLARLAVASDRRGAMAEFMDVHRGMVDITPEGLLEAHQADLAIQGEEAVDFKHAWADPKSGMVFACRRRPVPRPCSAFTSAPAILPMRSTRSQFRPSLLAVS
jgi:Protein of unknown function (DUF4242)